MHAWLDPQLDRLSTQRGQRLCLLAPRGEAKSTRTTLFHVLRQVATARDRYIWISSDTSGLTRKHLARLRHESEGNRALIEAYPDVFGEAAHYNADSITFGNGVVVEGVGKNSRGSAIGELRPTLRILDDPEGEDDVISALRRERNLEWFDGMWMKAGAPITNDIVLGTAVCPDCLVLNVSKRTQWTSRIFKAILAWPDRVDLWMQWREMFLHASGAEESDKQAAVAKADKFYADNKAAMDLGAELSWEKRYPLIDLMKEWAEDALAFAKERQNDPHNPEACEWPRDYFDYEGFWFDDWPDQITQRIMALDPSKGAGEESDYSAFTMLARDGKGIWYAECDLMRRNVSRIVKDAVTLIARFEAETSGRIDGLVVESNGFQDLIGPLLIPEAQSAKIDISPRLYEFNNLIRKEVRIRRLTSPLNRRLIRFRRTPLTRMVVDQAKAFPNGMYVDGLDSLEMACRLSIDLWQGTV